MPAISAKHTVTRDIKIADTHQLSSMGLEPTTPLSKHKIVHVLNRSVNEQGPADYFNISYNTISTNQQQKLMIYTAQAVLVQYTNSKQITTNMVQALKTVRTKYWYALQSRRFAHILPSASVFNTFLRNIDRTSHFRPLTTPTNIINIRQ